MTRVLLTSALGLSLPGCGMTDAEPAGSIESSSTAERGSAAFPRARRGGNDAARLSLNRYDARSMVSFIHSRRHP